MAAKRLFVYTFSLLLALTACAGGGGISRNQCGSQQDCGHQITYWQNAIDTVAQANFPDEKFNAIVHHKDFKNAWVTSGRNINITGLLVRYLEI